MKQHGSLWFVIICIGLIVLGIASCEESIVSGDSDTTSTIPIKRPVQGRDFAISEYITFEYDETALSSSVSTSKWAYEDQIIGENENILSKKANFFGFGSHTVSIEGTTEENTKFKGEVTFHIVETEAGITITF